jgi:hypothetical protein
MSTRQSGRSPLLESCAREFGQSSDEAAGKVHLPETRPLAPVSYLRRLATLIKQGIPRRQIARRSLHNCCTMPASSGPGAQFSKDL